MNLQENINRIKSVMGLINEQTSDVILKYVTDSNLVNILSEIEIALNDNFTDEHFKKEISMSGEIKPESGGLSQEAIDAFNKMKNESGCNDIFIKEKDDKDPTLNVSYRSYEDQKKRFINEGNLAPQGRGKIDYAMNRVSIPGYSQHHTGKAIDYGGNTICLRKNAWPNSDFNNINKWGFTLPYMSGNIRMKEPWHLYFEGENTTKDKKTIEITGTDLTSFMRNIQNQTFNISIDENSVILDMKNKILKVKEGDTQVFGLRLRFNDENEQTCQSCINTIDKNREYNPKTIKEIKWGNNNNRIAQIIAFYPIKTTN